jgi:hypothetical protein
LGPLTASLKKPQLNAAHVVFSISFGEVAAMQHSTPLKQDPHMQLHKRKINTLVLHSPTSNDIMQLKHKKRKPSFKRTKTSLTQNWDMIPIIIHFKQHVAIILTTVSGKEKHCLLESNTKHLA